MELYYVEPELINELELDRDRLTAHRVNILYMIQQAGAGHLGSALSSLEIVYYLYNYGMKEGDVYFSSKGHDCAGLYSILQSKDILPASTLHGFRRLYGLPGHPDYRWPGIEYNGGSLGLGLSHAQGMALAGHKGKIYVMLGDGELQEGQNFEAMRNIYKNNIRNIVALVDVNEFQCDFKVEDTSPFKDIMQTCYSLGWNVSYCRSGHDLVEISKCLSTLDPEHSNIVFFDTIKGKGVVGLEDTNETHSGMLKDHVYQDTITILCKESPEIGKILMKTPKKEKISPENANSLVKLYEKCITQFMYWDENIVVLNADLAKDCGIQSVKAQHKDRFFEFGISEQDQVSTASGMALKGKIPIVHGFSSFLVRRSCEQIYNQCTHGTKVIYIGFLSGYLPTGPGKSHENIVDIEIMKTMPNMLCMEPKNGEELEVCLKYALYHYEYSSYIKINCLPILEGCIR